MTKLLQQALDALLPHGSSYGNGKRPVEDAAIKAIEQALAQQEHPAQKYGNYKCPTCEHEQSSGEIECNNCGRTYLVEAPPTQPALSAELKAAVERTRFDLLPGSSNYPDVRTLLAFAEAAIEAHCRGGANHE